LCYPALTGAEVYGKDIKIDPDSTTPGATWFAVAELTFNQMLEQWDNNCGGGIYWSRNRLATAENQRTYKSTISNVQLIKLAGRLMLQNPQNSTYREVADRTFQWLKTTGILTPDYVINDGITAAATVCTAADINTDLVQQHTSRKFILSA
jgi:mannan endo-1,6-alpha-mannosidase